MVMEPCPGRAVSLPTGGRRGFHHEALTASRIRLGKYATAICYNATATKRSRYYATYQSFGKHSLAIISTANISERV